MPPALRRRLPICLVIWLHLFAGAGYGEAVPPWEAPDEPWHMAYAEVLASGRLPLPADTYEYHQPPLYYLWPALGLRILDRDRLPRSAPNPRYPNAIATVLHPPGEPGKAELRLLRAFSGLLATLTVALAWAAARAAWPRRGNRAPLDPPLLAALCVALLPQFVFITHSISNDTLASVCGALAIYGLVARRPHRRAVAAIALGLALGWLTKLNVMPLGAVVPLALARWRAGDVGAGMAPGAATRRALRVGAIVAAPLAATVVAVATLAPAVHDALFANAAARSAQSGGGVNGGVQLAFHVMRMITSLWARFGWLNVDLPAVFYLAAAVAVALAAVGLARGVMLSGWTADRREQLTGAIDAAGRPGGPARRAVGIAIAAVAAVFASAVANLFVDGQAQGRFLFPALPALAVVLAAGWECVATGRRAGILQAGVIALLVVANTVAVGWTLPRAYADVRSSQIVGYPIAVLLLSRFA